ncbi:MAG: GxxExxY protein [Nitrospirae bacterium]|nr:GxxExxY protein [Nitrospirota bacterium]
MKHEEITDKVINVFYKVYNALGYGFLEKVYKNAMIKEFNKQNIRFINHCPIEVYYEGEVIGDYIADFIVEDKVIVEIKAIKQLSKSDENQLLNYLTATDREVGLLLNYGEKPEIKRKIYDNELKKDRDSKNSVKICVNP